MNVKSSSTSSSSPQAGRVDPIVGGKEMMIRPKESSWTICIREKEKPKWGKKLKTNCDRFNSQTILIQKFIYLQFRFFFSQSRAALG